MTGFACLLLGLGLGMALDQWLQRNRPGNELADVQDTLELTRVDLHNARAELVQAEKYTAALLDDPAYYVAERNGVTVPEKWGR